MESNNTTEQSRLLPTAATAGGGGRGGGRRKSVIPTSAAAAAAVAATPQLTVFELLASSDRQEREEGFRFLRQTWALLFLQYGTILFIASPFVFWESFRAVVLEGAVHVTLGLASKVAIVLSLALAISKGTKFPYAHIALVALTCSVGLELGLTFGEKPWGLYGLMAIGQATTNFAVVLCTFQWEFPKWAEYAHVAVLCLAVSGMWVVVVQEAGESWKIAGYVGLGGWVFALIVLYSCEHVTKHVAPSEYILATLFILVPEALVCLGSKQRKPEEDEEDDS